MYPVPPGYLRQLAKSIVQGLFFKDMDLTGTWAFVQENQISKISTGEYLYSEFTEFNYVINESVDGTRYNRCWELGKTPSFAVKTDQNLYFDINSTGYQALSENLLERIEETDWYDWDDLENYVVQSLIRISNETLLDSGNFSINGPISVNETDHVCIYKHYNDIDDLTSLNLELPFDDRNISFSLYFHGTLQPGTINYVEWENGAQLRYFDVSSNATAFTSTVGSNTLAPDAASITVEVSDENTLKGTYSFVGQDNGSYNGTFEFDFTGPL